MEGVTAYVPGYSFVGRTPACAHTLVKADVKHVVITMLDPDPQ